MLLLHLANALLSIIFTTMAVVVPTQNKLRLSKLFVATTLATGTYLVISTHSPLLSSCMSGLFYLAIVSSGLVIANRRLARVTTR